MFTARKRHTNMDNLDIGGNGGCRRSQLLKQTEGDAWHLRNFTC